MWARRGFGRVVGRECGLDGRLRGRFVRGGRLCGRLFRRRGGSSLGMRGRFSFRFLIWGEGAVNFAGTLFGKNDGMI